MQDLKTMTMTSSTRQVKQPVVWARAYLKLKRWRLCALACAPTQAAHWLTLTLVLAVPLIFVATHSRPSPGPHPSRDVPTSSSRASGHGARSTNAETKAPPTLYAVHFPNFALDAVTNKMILPPPEYPICNTLVPLDSDREMANTNNCTSQQGLREMMDLHYAYLRPEDSSPSTLKFRTELLSRQFCLGRDACDDATVYAHPIKSPSWKGATDRFLHSLVHFFYAVARDVPLVIYERGRHSLDLEGHKHFRQHRWRFTPLTCMSMGHTCYFRETTSCARTYQGKETFPQRTWYQERKVPDNDMDHLAAVYGVSNFAMSAEMLMFMMQPNARLQAEIARAKLALNWDRLPRPILSVRMWRPNKARNVDGVDPEEADQFMQVALRAQQRHGYKTLLIMTDSKTALVQSLKYRSHFTLAAWAYPACMPELLNATQEPSSPHYRPLGCWRTGGCGEGVAGLMDMMLAAETQGFLGSFSETTDRTIARLVYAARTPDELNNTALWSMGAEWPERYGDVVVQEHVISDMEYMETEAGTVHVEMLRLYEMSRSFSTSTGKGNGGHKEKNVTAADQQVEGVHYPNFVYGTDSEWHPRPPSYRMCKAPPTHEINFTTVQHTMCRTPEGLTRLMHDHYAYLPPGDSSLELERFREGLLKRQFCFLPNSRSCAEATEYAHPNSNTQWGGYGARQLHALVLFFYALGRNVAFVLADLRTPPHPVHGEYHWQYTDRASCPNQGFGCYFKETTACPRHEARASRQVLFKLHSVPERIVTKVLAQSDLGKFVLTSEMLLFLMQPNNRVILELEEAKARLGWDQLPRPILSMHVRHGKTKHEGGFIPLQRYVQTALVAKAKYGFKSLFIFTDSKQVLEDVAQLTSHFTIAAWDYPKFTQTSFKQKHDTFSQLRMGRATGCEEALPILINIYLAIEAQGFVGVFMSNIDRVIARMAYVIRSPEERRNTPLWSVSKWPQVGFDIVTRDSMVVSTVEHDGEFMAIEAVHQHDMNATTRVGMILDSSTQ